MFCILIFRVWFWLKCVFYGKFNNNCNQLIQLCLRFSMSASILVKGNVNVNVKLIINFVCSSIEIPLNVYPHIRLSRSLLAILFSIIVNVILAILEVLALLAELALLAVLAILLLQLGVFDSSGRNIIRPRPRYVYPTTTTRR